MARRTGLIVAIMSSVVLRCPTSSPNRVELRLAPAASAPVAVVSPLPPPTLPGTVPIHSQAGASWARTFIRAKTFHRIVTPAGSPLTLAWRIGPQHNVKDLPPDEDYPANHVQPIDLLVGEGEGSRTLAFGELAGWVERYGLTYCRGLGFSLAKNDEWTFPPDPSVASSFSIGVPQGDSDLLLVRDDDVLHVLHRETSDGRCDEIQQGPLHACEDSEWILEADIRVPAGAELREIVLDESRPIDCGVDHYGSSLVPPER